MTPTSSRRYSNQRRDIAGAGAGGEAFVDDQLERVGNAGRRGRRDQQRERGNRDMARIAKGEAPDHAQAAERAALGAVRGWWPWRFPNSGAPDASIGSGRRLFHSHRTSALLRCSIRLQRTPMTATSIVFPPFPRGSMLYDAYEVQRSLLAGASKLAGLGAGWLNNPSNPWGYSSMGPLVAASLEVFAHASAPRGKPEFGLDADQGRAQGRRGRRGHRPAQAVRAAQAFPQGRRRVRAAAADRRADVGPLCDAAARNGRAAAAAARRLHHRLARREAGAGRATAASISTITSII